MDGLRQYMTEISTKNIGLRFINVASKDPNLFYMFIYVPFLGFLVFGKSSCVVM